MKESVSSLVLAFFAVSPAGAQWSSDALTVHGGHLSAVTVGDLGLSAGGGDGLTTTGGAVVDIYDASTDKLVGGTSASMSLTLAPPTGGGGLTSLGRHTVAALLNSASDDVDYGPTSQDVVDMFNAVYPGSKSDDNELTDFSRTSMSPAAR